MKLFGATWQGIVKLYLMVRILTVGLYLLGIGRLAFWMLL